MTSVPFSEVADFLEHLERLCRINPVKARTAKLRQEFGHFLTYHHQTLFSGPSYEALSDLIHLLIPWEDSSRKFGLQETSLVKELIRILGLENTPRATRLRDWKGDSGGREAMKGQGNLGSIVGDVVGITVQNSSSMDIRQLNLLLDELATFGQYSTTDTGHRPKASNRKRSHILSDLYCRQCALSSKWITRILLKDMLPLSFKWNSILFALHPCASILYRTQQSIQRTAKKVHYLVNNGFAREKIFNNESGEMNSNLLSQALKLCGNPAFGLYISSMECVRPSSVPEILSSLAGQREKQFYAEIKYDGERMQIHVMRDAANQIRIFSKSGRNSTIDRIESHPIIQKALGLDASNLEDRVPGGYQVSCSYPKNLLVVNDCVLEGELLVFDEDRQEIEKFGGVADFRPIAPGPRKSGNKGSRHLMIIFFDVLCLNGSDLMREPFICRRRALEAIIQPTAHYAELSNLQLFQVPKIPMSLPDCDPLSGYFASVIANAQEGLIIKGERSFYEPGKRKNWFKLKMGYLGLGESAEYAVIGGSFDRKCNNFLNIDMEQHPYLLNTFFVGCLTNKSEVLNQGVPGEFRIMFSFTTGFSKDELIRISQELDSIRTPCCLGPAGYTATRPLTYDITYKNCQVGKIDFLLKEPVVVELVGQEYVFDHFTQFWTLRHPNFVRRCGTDKLWMDTMSFQELQELATSKANAEAGQRMLGNTMESIGRITRAFFESKSTKRDASVLSDLHQKRTRIDKNCKRSCLDPSQEDEDDNSDASSIFSMTTIAEEEDVPKTGHDLPIPFSPSRTLQLCNSWIYIHQSLFHLQEEHREALSILSQTKLGKRVIHGLDSVVEKLLDCAQPIQEGLVFLLDPEATGSKNLRQNLLEMRAQISRPGQIVVAILHWNILRHTPAASLGTTDFLTSEFLLDSF